MKKGEMKRSTRLSQKKRGSGRLDNSPGTDAAGADIGMHGAAAAGEHPHSLEVGQPTATGLIMGVADVISRRGAFAANFTSTGHDRISSKKIG
jgi:hypothetical protein